MSETKPAATTRRLFIGNISAQLHATPEDITSRISRFGTLKSDFETHFNEVRGTAFGYLTVEIDNDGYSKLKTSLHKVQFKGSQLIIDIAKDDFEKTCEADRARSDTKQRTKMMKNQWEYYRKMENVKMTFRDHQEVIRGRMRKSRRRAIKNMTLRVNFNGTIKLVKCPKQKLWGYEKNKKLRDLVYRFSNNVWKDGNDHIVERLSMVKIKQGSNTLSIEVQRDDEKILANTVDEEEEDMEAEKNTKVLASILGNFNFDKPLDYQEQVDEFGGSDYEYNNSYLESDTEDFITKSVDLSEIEYVREGEFGKDSQPTSGERVYDEDEDDDNDLYATNTYTNDHPYYEEQRPVSYPEAERKEQESEAQDEMEVDEVEGDSEEEEFIPTFGAEPEGESKTSATTVVEGTVSNTETLRSLFTADAPTTFNLIGDDADIDHSIPVPELIQLPTTPMVSSILPKKNKRALFFTHLDSPFLVAQTQVNKLEQPVDFEKWDETFWEKRSEWTKDCKRRKRDVLRQMRKKNAKNSRVFV